ncbi:hypothetical protein [Marinimicrobium sp. ABcell2]|uniref:hypothetical protein n=1 Tax=Marinimicrobium sp. ABcell2 TaxID=3069751 RepID=UPI0027B08439|nr:hypothetical protein [Marinimicrobium sp. ABcell2]MDQ2077205.1 hypothetical protein [Marinimicrobium sp. ABcell2]
MCVLFALGLGTGSPAVADGEWYLSAYWAKNSPDRLLDILQTSIPELRSTYLNAVAVNYAYAEGRLIRWELEGQLVRHYGMQDHWETNALVVARWMHFPWDHILDTRVAYGGGLSYALEVPYIEPRSEPEREDSTRLLHYLLLEVEVTLPEAERWSAFARIHHRSGVFGLFDGVRGGSNFIGVGVRYQWK